MEAERIAERAQRIEHDDARAACEWFGREAKACVGCPAFEHGRGMGCVKCMMLDAAGALGGAE